MKILSMNICDFGGLPKQKDLVSLFSDLFLDIIILQETMCPFSQSLILFSKIKHGWEYCALDADGLSGGLLAGWNPLLVQVKDFSSLAGIIVRVTIKGIEDTLSVINYYDPYTQRIDFWDNIVADGLLSLQNIILVGDLNFTISSSEV